jgi:SpoVK/Ycf46/Vps4 family AAA+-type ATPase
MDLDELLRRERQKEEKRKIIAPEAQPEDTGGDLSSDEITPYKNDLQYLDDHFQLIAQKLKVKSMEARLEIEAQYDDEMRDTRSLRQKREALGKCKVLEKKCEKRLALTREAGSWMPRLERMATSRGLCLFEKNILLTLIGFIIQPNKINPGFDSYGQTVFSVGELLRLFCVNLHDQIKHRVYFYKAAPMVREGMIIVNNSGLTGDPTNTKVEIDRRMLDFCAGLDTEFSEIVEGSHLYFPQTKFEQVILSQEQKQLIFSTVSNFEAYKRCRRKMGLDDTITYGAGMVLLFYGAPGTGKTMMANALANKMQKKVLLINFPSLGSMSAGENFKFIFREAKINDAILFFDECEAIFETREKGSHNVNMLLTEIERHDGLIIMATNRPYDLDEAMHRRIMIAIEFRQPDHLLRKAIWESHIPKQMKLADDTNLDELSLRYELSGGFIKNAILSALSIAVSRDGENPVVCHKDLQQGANLQLRGALRMKDFHRRVLPTSGLDKVVVEEKLMKTLREIVQFEKARSVLFGQWGFGVSEQQGITVLLHGAPGTGKSLAAQALGYEVGRPLKVVNCGELLSKWVGESTKNIDAIFEESRNSDAILVFDEAEGLFGSRTTMSTSTDRYANVDVGVLLYHIERFPGIIILTTNLIENIDKAFFRRLRFVLHFETPPTRLRARLWKILIPQETPLSDDIDYEALSRQEMTGGNIKSCIFRAACRAALRTKEERRVTQQDLMEAAEEEVGKESTRTSFRRQDSDAARMYN